MCREAFEDVEIQVHAGLRGDGEHEGVGGLDGGVGLQLLDELIRFPDVGAAEGRAVPVDDADLVGALPGARPEQHAVLLGDDREHAAGDGDARGVGVPGLAECRAVAVDLLGLEIAEGSARGLGEQRRAHQVQPLAARLLGGLAGARAPPDPSDQLGGVGLDPQIGARCGMGHVGLLRSARHRLALDGLEEQLELLPRDVRPTRVGRTGVAEGLPAAVRRLGAAAGDAERHPAVGDEIERRGLLCEVQRVLVAHIDHSGAHLDPLRARGDGGQQRHRGGGLLGEVVDAEVGAVHAQLVGADGDVDRVVEHLPGAEAALGRAAAVVTEAEESEGSHGDDPTL